MKSLSIIAIKLKNEYNDQNQKLFNKALDLNIIDQTLEDHALDLGRLKQVNMILQY